MSTGNTEDLASLQARITELESRNDELQRLAAEPAAGQGDPPAKSTRSVGRARTATAVVLVLVAAVLAPIAVLGTWVRAELVDTDRFVQTFAPLAEDAEVQAFIADQAAGAIEQSVDIDGLVSELFDGVSDLDLPPRAQDAVALLQGPAGQGVRSLIGTAIDGVVTSPQFAQLWSAALHQTHSRAIAVIQGDTDAALQLQGDGTLTLEVGALIGEVKQILADQGLGLVSNIPDIDRSIPLVSNDALPLVCFVYQVAVAAGYWLPWGVLALCAAAVAVSRNRVRALAWVGGALAVSLLVLVGGLGIGRAFFVGTVSPSVMAAPAATAIFDQITEQLVSASWALIVLAIFVALGGWISGTSRSASAVRSASNSGMHAVRDFCDAHGLSTGAFGRGVERWRSLILGAAVAIGVAIVFTSRPATVGKVVVIVIAVLAVMLIVELVRRPQEAK